MMRRVILWSSAFQTNVKKFTLSPQTNVYYSMRCFDMLQHNMNDLATRIRNARSWMSCGTFRFSVIFGKMRRTNFGWSLAKHHPIEKEIHSRYSSVFFYLLKTLIKQLTYYCSFLESCGVVSTIPSKLFSKDIWNP